MRDLVQQHLPTRGGLVQMGCLVIPLMIVFQDRFAIQSRLLWVAANRWQQAFKKNLQLTYEIFNFVRNST